MRNILDFQEDGIDIVYCCLSSGQTALAATATSIFQMIHFAFFTSPDYMTENRSKFPFFSRLVPKATYQVDAIYEVLTYLSKQSNQKQYLDVGIIVTADAYGITGGKSMNLKAEQYNVNIKAYQQFLTVYQPDGSFSYDIDVSVEISELKDSGARVFVGIMEPNNFVIIANKSVEYGIIGDHYVWICFEGCASPFAYLNIVTKTIDTYTLANMQGMIGINQVGYRGQEFLDLVDLVANIDKTIFPVDFLYPTLPFQYIYDGVFFLATAIQQMIEEEGFTEEGKLINKQRFLEIILNTTYTGVTGLIELTPEGDRTPHYDIVNLQVNQTAFTRVGSWDLDNGLQMTGDIQFYDGSNEIPDIDIREPIAYWSCSNKERGVDLTGKTVKIDKPNSKHKNGNIDYDYYCDNFIDCENLSDESGDCSSNYTTLFIVFGVITGVLILIAIIFFIFTIIFGFIFRRKRIISASPVFLIIIVISCIVGYSSIFAWYGKPSKVGCGFQPWLLGLPVISMISALCAKTFRIWRIFKSPFNRKVITDFELIVLWMILMLPAVIILALWTLISTPTATMKDIDGVDHYVCETGGFTGPPGGYVFFGIFVGYSAIVLFFGAFLSFVTRNVPALFNESKLISLSIYNIVFEAIVFIPVVIVLGTINPYISWIIRSVGILYAFTATLWFQFLPKIIPLIFIDRFQNTSKSTKSLSQLETNTTDTKQGSLANIPEAHSDELS